MSKTIMIAQREFMENMRTKTFWIGVLAAPVGIVLVYGLMFLLAGKTDLRRYAVLDHSADKWFSKKIEEKSNKNEFAKIFELMKAPEEDKEKQAEKEQFAKRIQEKLEDLPTDHPFQRLFAQYEEAGLYPEFAKAKGDLKKMSEEARKKANGITMKWTLAVMLNEKDRKLAISFISGLAMKNYVDVGFKAEGDDPEAKLKKMLQNEEIFAYFVIHDPLKSDEKSKYVSNNLTDTNLRKHFSGHATQVLRDAHVQRLRKEKDLSKKDVADINASFDFDKKQIDESGTEENVEMKDTTRSFAPLVFVYVLWIAIVVMAQMLLTNTVEEKSNRIIEVLLSSVSPVQLMHGKIYGLALTGVIIIGSWAAFLIAGVKLAPALLPAQGVTMMAEFGLNEIVQDPVFLASFIGYFITGYLFYAAILVAIGSVCDSLKEAQNLFQPVMFALFVPLATMFPITRDPNGTLAQIITYIPLYTPFAMMNRASGPPPMWEYILSSVIILVSIWLAFRGAAKVFRVGILMTGKPPKITEIIKWLRAPVK
jgi:ABC-type Na+ efflux pump permease subunit